ncbi:unnamed protein product [Rodentolepis nana]|uniref:Transposase n=1 Tax=Rodentolepis nana TaxID=102285 RepID=A0A0R3TJS1_RODNA|nr:unnamed protein product [Rodentolepis nana]
MMVLLRLLEQWRIERDCCIYWPDEALPSQPSAAAQTLSAEAIKVRDFAISEELFGGVSKAVTSTKSSP